MQKWEYTMLVVDNEHRNYSVNGDTTIPIEAATNTPMPTIVGLLNDMGEMGWEMVTAELVGGGPGKSAFLLKRPVE